MFSKLSTLSALVLAAPLFVRAVVTPSEPGPGSSYTAGQTCTVRWAGDTESATLWADMSIQLMTGSNFEMVHVTTVATGQDGTSDGEFTYTCPEVDPYSAIYFYQFTNPITDEKTWTTRFTITSPEGETVDPEEATQPGTGDAIPWGTGALADPAAVIPPPVIGGASSDGVSSSPSTSVRPTASSSSSSSSRISTVRSTPTSGPTASGGASQSPSAARPSGAQISTGANSGAVALKASSLLTGLAVSAMSLFVFA